MGKFCSIKKTKVNHHLGGLKINGRVVFIQEGGEDTVCRFNTRE